MSASPDYARELRSLPKRDLSNVFQTEMVIAVDVQLRRESREVAVVYFIIQVVEGNILVPLVMRNAIGVPPFLVIVSILAGAAIAGTPAP